MKLNIDFSKLFYAVDKMGAVPISFNIGHVEFVEIGIDEILGTTGQEINLEDLESFDNLLSYKGRQVLLYIPDQGNRIDNVLLNSQNGTRFHVADCKTLQEMKSKKRFDRYIVTNNLSGIFNINGINFNGEEINETSRLHVCKNCLSLLNYKNYKQNRRVFDEFKLEDFFEVYSTLFSHLPKFEDQIYSSDYTNDWENISQKYKAKKNYVCETCDTSFINNKSLLHTHHINGIKEDNDFPNLKVLCLDCHRKEPNHEHLMLNRIQLEQIYILRREQNKINIKNWDDVFKYTDLALHNYIHILKSKPNMKIPDVGYIFEINGKKIILDLVWITNSRKSALVTEYTTDYFALDDWNIQILSDALVNFGETNPSKIRNSFEENKTAYLKSNSATIKYLDIEKSDYSYDLYEINLPNFEKIKRVTNKYIDEGNNKNTSNYELCKNLNENGKRDKSLMYSLFEEIAKNYVNKSINIIDWQCNQSINTLLFLDYIREKQLNIKVDEILLVESNENSLKRALLHIDILKEQETTVKGINNNFSVIKDGSINLNGNITVHFYSTLLNGNYKNKKISLLDSIKFIQRNENYFVCISECKDKRIDDFYNFTKEKYTTKLILENDSKVGKYTKYEKVFFISK